VAGDLDTDDLIARLALDARPVRRLAPPALRATVWLLGALAAMAAIIAYHGLRPGLAEALAEPGGWLSILAAGATGVAATYAAFHLAIPGTSRGWALLPLPVALLWASGLGLGCYAEWLRQGPAGLEFGEAFDCFLAIVLISLLVGLPMLAMLRHGRLIRPVQTAAMGGLAVASLASAALELFHEGDARIMDVIWHVAAVMLIVALSSGSGAAAGRSALRAST